MAKFLSTTGVSHYLEELIKNTSERLVLISPFLKFNDRFKQILSVAAHKEISIYVLYGKKELFDGEKSWLKSLKSIQLGFIKDLHAKCYISEKAAIITSMNLLDFSQVNNNEMGILVEKNTDPELYEDILKEAEYLLRISDGSVSSVQDLRHRKDVYKPHYGFCIRTGVQIPFDIDRPMTMDAFKEWANYSDWDYKEKFCHLTGEPSNGYNCKRYPVLSKNWKKATEAFPRLNNHAYRL